MGKNDESTMSNFEKMKNINNFVKKYSKMRKYKTLFSLKIKLIMLIYSIKVAII